MTLALYGKSRRRQWMLVALALFALLGAVAATMGLWARAGADKPEQPPQFSVFTSIENITDTSECENGGGTGVNCNIYSAKESVYLNGGPSTSFLPDGYYCFSVYNPNSTTLLSSDPAAQRTFQVSGGDILYSGNHNTGLDTRSVSDPEGEKTIQFFPYNNTSNPGGVYKYALYQYASEPAAGVGNECSQTGVTVTKTDNFKIAGSAVVPTITKVQVSGGVNPTTEPADVKWVVEVTSTGYEGDILIRDLGVKVQSQTIVTSPFSCTTSDQANMLNDADGVTCTVGATSKAQFLVYPAGTVAQTCSPQEFPNTAEISLDGTTWTPAVGPTITLSALSPTDPACAAPSPSIAINKSNDTGGNVNAGGTFNWIIKVTVSGATTTAATAITDTIPADFTASAPVEASAQLDCSASSGNSISCTLASGAPVGEYTITVPVDVSEDPEICGEPITNTAVAQMGTEPAIDDDDDVTINCGQVASTGNLRIEKYLDINGDGDADDVALGEGPIEDWDMTVNGPDENGVFPTGADGSVSFSGLTTGDNYTITEALPAGWVLTNVKVDGANSAVNVTKSVTIPDGTTRVVAYYNQPLGSLTVNKVALTSHNNSPDVPSPQDRDGWDITVFSALCGYSDTQPTDTNGSVTFTGLPLCTDYLVSENTSNPASPGFVPISATSVANQTPNGPAVTFVNRRATFDILIITPTPFIPTPTSTPVPPTATPTNTVVPPTNTPQPTPIEETAGERTPGPTPIAPSTGTGSGGGSANMNILLLVAGLAVLSGGLSLTVAGKRRRS
ncbi:MAG: hypothetical protein IH609_10525 [Dehalococcoidia bacterium]|nr:hypothetical protein [Dehalococcoidia bacterium]